MSVYIDTSAFLAICNADDSRHEAAKRAWRGLIERRETIVTTNYTIVETASLLHGRHGIPALRYFVEDMLAMVMIEWISPEMHSVALSAVLSASGKQSPSLVDCAGFEAIRKGGIRDVFAYDKHFADRGFNLIG